MNQIRSRSRRVGMIVLGVLAIGASLLWLLFWLFGLAWFWPPDLGIAVLVGVCFALGIAVILVGLFLIANWFPGRWGWIVAGTVACVPLFLLVPLALSTSAHRAEVERAATRALAVRSGASSVTAECSWYDDRAEGELWRCDVSSTKGVDRCFVLIIERGSDKLGAVVDRCEREHAAVAKYVGNEYRKLRSAVKTADRCFRQSSASARRGELWSCDLEPAGDDGFCYANVRWGVAGRVSVSISHCERELSTAVVMAYSSRSGTRADRVRCTEDEQNDGEWICDIRTTVDRDRCFVAFGSLAAPVASAKIFYCQQELVTAVDRLVEGMYEKRTQFDDVTAACTLEEHAQWNCDIRLPSGRDRCDVWVERRAAGPRVEMKLTTCASGRV